MTKNELEGYLYMIRDTLCAYNYGKLDNVIFFNNDAVFEYLCDIPLESMDMTVGEALDKIGAFIPISLNADSIRFIAESSLSPEKMESMESDFDRSNKMDFMQLLTAVTSQKEWNNLLNLCNTIREFRVNEEAAVLH